MINKTSIKLLAYGIISLMVSYWTTAWASESVEWFNTSSGMTIGIVAVFSATFLGLLYWFKW